MQDGGTSQRNSNPVSTKLNVGCLGRGRVDDMSFFDYLSPFCFCQLNFIVLVPFLIKYYHILFIIIVFWLGCDRRRDFFFSCPLCFFPPSRYALFLSSSSVSLSYLILAVLMRECLGKHSCMSFPFPIVILNGTFFFAVKAMNNWKRSAIKQILLLRLLLLGCLGMGWSC